MQMKSGGKSWTVVGLRRTGLALACGVVLLTEASASGFAGGNGLPGNPYQITTREHLESVNDDLNAHYVLMNDLDLAGTIYNQAPIAPNVGAGSPWFLGVFDGNGHTIRNLDVHHPTAANLALFGYVSGPGRIENLTLEDVDVSGTGDYIGGLVGWNSGTISGCRVTGSVAGGTYCGGLAAYSDTSGSLSDCDSAASVNGDGVVGGLVGQNNGTVEACSATGQVTGTGHNVGGLVGLNAGTITRCYARVNVTSSASNVGGLAGSNWEGEILDSYARGSVDGAENVGGLVGINHQGRIVRCYSTGLVTGAAPIGGLVGFRVEGGIYEDTANFWDENASVQGTSAMGEGKTTGEMQTQSTFTDDGWDFVGEIVNGTDDIWKMPSIGYPMLAWQMSFAGGDGTEEKPYQITTREQLEAVNEELGAHYILMNDLDLAGKTYARAVIAPFFDFPAPLFTGSFDGNGKVIRNLTITGGGNSSIGLFGWISGDSGSVFALGLENVDVSGTDYVGGLVGVNFGTIRECHAIGNVSGNIRVGGLVGDNARTIRECYTTGTVDGNDFVGGLVGDNRDTIRKCYATGSVIGRNNVGGLVGRNVWGTIQECYATRTVDGILFVGGLVGHNYRGKVIHCYSVGAVSGTSNVGGLVGSKDDEDPGYEDTDNFWNEQTSQQFTSAMGTPKNTAQMQNQATFTDAGWDFFGEDANGTDDIWRMPHDTGYPKLTWQIPFPGGNGSAGNPYHIVTRQDLEAVNAALDAHFILMNDLDLAGTVYGQAVIAPYADAASPWFTGSLDGNEKTIRNLTIQNTGADFIGLIGLMTSPGKVFDLNLADVSILGSGWVGGLVAFNGGDIERCRVHGQVTGLGDNVGGLLGVLNGGKVLDSHAAGQVSGDNYVGGLIGAHFYATVERSSASASVAADGDRAGGLIGQDAGGDVTECFATGAVTGGAGYVGGFVGQMNDSVIADCYAWGDVAGLAHVGGFAGRNHQGAIVRCYATGKPAGTSDVGGFAGSVDTGGGYADTANFWDEDAAETSVSAMGNGESTATMQTQGTFTDWDFPNVWRMPAASYPRLAWEYGYTKGNGMPINPYRIYTREQLEGVNDNLMASYRLMTNLDLVEGIYDRAVIAPYVDGASPWFAGRFDGNEKTIRNLTVLNPSADYIGLFGRVAGSAFVQNLTLEGCHLQGDFYTGAVAGRNDGDITNCRTSPNVMVEGDYYVGGLVGWNEGNIDGSHARGNVSGTGEDVGGLAGHNRGTISSGFATGAVIGEWYVGGLAGRNRGTIQFCFATGAVGGAASLGGLVGLNESDGLIRNSYARGTVDGGLYGYHVGGLVGRNDRGRIVNTYATGTVHGESSLGGLAGSRVTGSNYEDTANFWDTQTSVQDASVMGTGKTTAEMRTQSTFTDADWSFPLVWLMDDDINDGYPHLQSAPPPAMASRPWFNPDGGVFVAATGYDVTVGCATPGATIRFTLDGSDPDENSPLVVAGDTVEVELPATLKARAWAPDMDPSRIQSAFFDGETVNGVRYSWLAGHGYATDGTADFVVPPGKRLNVRGHFIADLDPHDVDSDLRVLGVSMSSPVTVTFEPASTEREYTLQYKEDLTSVEDWLWVPGQVRIPGSGGVDSLVDNAPSATGRFYRVTVELP